MNTTDDDDLGAFTVAEFCRRFSIGVTSFYEQVKAGRLRTVKVGRKTLVLRRDARAWIAALDEAA